MTSAASPRSLADWATASTLIETSDCLDPTGKPEPVGTQPSDHEPAVMDKDTTVDDDESNTEDDQLENAEPQGAVEDTQTPATTKQSEEEQLAEELSAVKAENVQLRAQLDKIHAMLTGQVKVMNAAVRSRLSRSVAWQWLLLGEAQSLMCLRAVSCVTSSRYSTIAPRAQSSPAAGTWVR
jgi:hypothetical protein